MSCALAILKSEMDLIHEGATKQMSMPVIRSKIVRKIVLGSENNNMEVQQYLVSRDPLKGGIVELVRF